MIRNLNKEFERKRNKKFDEGMQDLNANLMMI